MRQRENGRCFGVVDLELDKMAGMRVSQFPHLVVRGWDQRGDFDHLPSRIVDAVGNVLWEGNLLSDTDINTLMGETILKGNQPLKYRLRSGALGKPKDIASIRFMSRDGIFFDLQLFDIRKGEILGTICSVSASVRAVLHISANTKITLFDQKRDKNKLERLS